MQSLRRVLNKNLFAKNILTFKQSYLHTAQVITHFDIQLSTATAAITDTMALNVIKLLLCLKFVSEALSFLVRLIFREF
jgi:hypothetical protein